MANESCHADKVASPSVAALLVLVVATSWSAVAGDSTPPVEEIEPNDEVATATDTGLTGLGTVTIQDAFLGNGPLGSDWDADFFSFEVQKGLAPVLVSVEVKAAGPDLDTFVYLQDGSGWTLASNDDRSFDRVDPRSATVLLEPGVYYVGVSASASPYGWVWPGGGGRPDRTGAYTLTISVESAAIPESLYEPNDTVETATVLGSESFTVSGEFIGDGASGRRDVDAYKLALTGPARLDIEVHAESIGSTLDPVVQMWGVLAINDDTSDGSVDPVLTLGIPEATDVYVLVYGSGNPAYRSPLVRSSEPGSVGFYDLSVTVTYLDGGGAYEPNDSLITAFVPSDESSGPPWFYEAHIGDGPYALTRGDRDFYRVETSLESGMLIAEVTPAGGSDFNPVLLAYDADGYRVAFSDATGSGRSQRVFVPMGCADPFSDFLLPYRYFMVMGTGQRPPNDPYVPYRNLYSDRIVPRYEEFAANDGPGDTGGYELSIRVAHEPCALEPNDTLPTAAPSGIVDEGVHVCTGGTIAESACEYPDLDVDMWSVELVHAPAVLGVLWPRCRDYTENGEVRVFDAAGNELAPEGVKFELNGVETQVSLLEPGRYYVGVSGTGNVSYDPMVPCSGGRAVEIEKYDIVLTLTQSARGSTAAALTAEPPSVSSVLFATRLDVSSNMIDALDSSTGEVTQSFEAPEPWFSGAEGLAFDGMTLTYLGVGRFPRLYTLDPGTGDVLRNTTLWFGSGYYSDAAMLGGLLYLLDYYDRSIHVMDPEAGLRLRTLEPGLCGGTTVGGGLAALAEPDRLYVADAFNSGHVFEINPVSGAATGLFTPLARPISLAGVGNHGLLYAADWDSTTLEVLDTNGNHMAVLNLDSSIGALAGQSFGGAFRDCNDDGMPDAQNIETGTSGDCNGNRTPDECDVRDRTSFDCNTNGTPDECEDECNANGVPDECDLSDMFFAASPRLSHIGVGYSKQFALPAPHEATGDVVLSFTAFGDFSNASEFIDVDVNGRPVGRVFASGAADCPDSPDTVQLVVPAAAFNEALASSGATIRMTASAAVDAMRCEAASFIAVSVQYPVEPTSPDCNGNGIPDECEADCNGNGVQDDCDIGDGSSEDSGGNGVPDECERILFVDADAPDGGTGNSWADPLDDLPRALTVAADRSSGISEIHVAAGTYTPTGPDGDRQATFAMISGVAIYGGYAGYGAPDPNERDMSEFETILSGDLNGDDLPDLSTHKENSYHVVVASGVDATAILDGFTITGGFANGIAPMNNYGAGVYNVGGSPTIVACNIAANYVSSHPGGPHLDIRYGAGMYNFGGKPTLIDSTFRGNTTTGTTLFGAGMYNAFSSPTLINCRLIGNVGARVGGGMFNESSRTTLIRCAFVGNSLGFGSAIRDVDSHTSIVNTLFVGNESVVSTVISVVGGHMSMVNCTLAANRRPNGSQSPSLSCHSGPCNVSIRNSILWNGGDEVLLGGEAGITISYSDVAGGWTGPGEGNIDMDPLFADVLGPDGLARTEDDDLRLLPGSPCINTGDPGFVPAPDEMDLDGHTRVLCGRVDMGAYEFGIGDIDCNHALDLADFAELPVCLAGPGTGLKTGCEALDFDFDGNVDLADFAGFQRMYMPAPPGP